VLCHQMSGCAFGPHTSARLSDGYFCPHAQPFSETESTIAASLRIGFFGFPACDTLLQQLQLPVLGTRRPVPSVSLCPRFPTWTRNRSLPTANRRSMNRALRHDVHQIMHTLKLIVMVTAMSRRCPRSLVIRFAMAIECTSGIGNVRSVKQICDRRKVKV
jgi:hypothetical protein